MDATKSILHSRTIWSNLVGFGCFALALIGVETGAIDRGAVTEALLNTATGVSFLTSTFFRVAATKRVAGPIVHDRFSDPA